MFWFIEKLNEELPRNFLSRETQKLLVNIYEIINKFSSNEDKTEEIVTHLITKKLIPYIFQIIIDFRDDSSLLFQTLYVIGNILYTSVIFYQNQVKKSLIDSLISIAQEENVVIDCLSMVQNKIEFIRKY